VEEKRIQMKTFYRSIVRVVVGLSLAGVLICTSTHGLSAGLAAGLTERPVQSGQPVRPENNEIQALNGTIYDPEMGAWDLPEGVSLKASKAPLSPVNTGGPDEYGYTWDDSVALSWVNATSGTRLGFTGSSSGQYTGPISLPFTFRYYENSYTSLYIAASGYIGFTNGTYWPWQPHIPSPEEPNNIVAPYATPLNLASSGSTNRVYYMNGGSAPNRYFVVEWYQVVRYAYTYTYEVILHENGDVVFNYQTFSGSGTRSCGYSGIENTTGLDGLSNLASCEMPTSNSAVRFYRPAASARVIFAPNNQAQFSHANAVSEFTLSVKNTGDLGDDTFDFTSLSGWPVALYHEDGTTSLTDTDGDGKIDSGNLAQGSSKTIVVKTQVPGDVIVGDNDCAAVTATSSINTSKAKSTDLCLSIPAPFAHVFMDYDNGAQSLDLVQATNQKLVSTIDYHGGDDSAITETSNGFVTADVTYYWGVSGSIGEIYYTLVDKYGITQVPPVRLTDNSSALYDAYDEYPAIAVAPDGHIGLLWQRYLTDSSDQFNSNMYFAILDEYGNVTQSPTSLTNNTTYGDYNDYNISYFYNAGITATGDNHFVMTWGREFDEAAGYVEDVYVAIRDTDNVEVLPVTKMTNDVAGYSEYYQNPAVASLTGNRYLLAYSTYNGLVYSVYDSAGNVVKPVTSIGPYAYQTDIIQLSSGRIVLAYLTYDNTYIVGYAILNGTTYTRIIGPNTLYNPYALTGEEGVSLAADEDGHAVIVSYDDNTGSNIYYALIDGNGGVLNPPMPVYTSNESDSIYTNMTGYSITSYHLTTSAGVDDNISSTEASLASSDTYAKLPVIYRNAGAITSTGVTVTATLDAGLAYWYDTSGITPSHVGNVYTWVIPDLDFLDGGQFDIYIDVPAAPSGTAYPVSLEISSAETDTNPADNIFNLNVVIAYHMNIPMIMK
jgi:hypothetical protein